MASIRKDPDGSGNWRISFRFRGKQYQRSARTDSEAEADAIRGRIEETIALVIRGRVVLPEGADVGDFLFSDGKLAGKVAQPAVADSATLGRLVDRYFASPPVAKEKKTLAVERSYLRNVRRVLGDEKPVAGIDLAAMQVYARRRIAEAKKPVPYTVRKEAKTLRYVWAWGVRAGLIASPPGWEPGDLELPKEREPGRYLTLAEIEARIERGRVSPEEVRRLRSNLYLSGDDLAEVLGIVAGRAEDPWLHPAVCLAGLTGARRSELLRSRVEDIDFEHSQFFVREKKRDVRKSTTTRAVDLHPSLESTMRGWLGVHPGGPHTLCFADGSPLNPDVMDHRLRSVLAGTRWEAIRGWHTFRHSFCSILASRGVDQRVIDAFVGHQTEEMRRRYRHLFPQTLRSAIMGLLPA